jgi:hypothetical protein
MPSPKKHKKIGASDFETYGAWLLRQSGIGEKMEN